MDANSEDSLKNIFRANGIDLKGLNNSIDNSEHSIPFY